MRVHIRGYTLIEVLVVIAVIAVLIGIAVPAYTNYRNKGYMAEGFALLTPFQKRVEEACNSDVGGGTYNVFGTGNGGVLTDVNGNAINFIPYKSLRGVQWFYTTSGSPPYFLIRFNTTNFPAQNGGAASYLLLYMVDNGNCNISWVCQNHPTFAFQFTDKYLPKFCSMTNTYGT